MRRKLLALTIIALLAAIAGTYFYFAAKAVGYASLQSENFIGMVQTTLEITMVDSLGNVRTIILTPSYKPYAVWTPVSRATESVPPQITSITVTLDVITWGIALRTISRTVGATTVDLYYDVEAQVNMTIRRWNSYTTAQDAMRSFFTEIDRGKSTDEAFAYVTGTLGQWGSWSENFDTQTLTYYADTLRYRKTLCFTFNVPSVVDNEKEWAQEILFGWRVKANGTAIAGNQVTAQTDPMYLAKPENEAYILKLQIIRTEWGWLSISVTVGMATSAWVPPRLYNIAPVLIDTVTKLLALLQMALTTVILVERVRK